MTEYDRVEADPRVDPNRDCPGTIVLDRGDDTVDVQWDDGDVSWECVENLQPTSR